MDMSDPNTPPTTGSRTTTRWKALGVLGLVGLATGIVVLAGACSRKLDETNEVKPAQPQPEPSIGNVPLFQSWPKDAKPDVAIVLSGQTFGYLQPCGCSRPQLGGLERRANFMASLRAKGWPVLGADLGDLYPPKGAVAEQSLLKYATAMNALREMGYVGIGVGKSEFSAGLLNVVAQYALQKEQPPYTLAGNVVGMADGKLIPRAEFFPPAPGGKRPLIGLDVVEEAGGVPVGVVGVVGPTLAKEAEKADPLLGFQGSKEVLAEAVKELAAHPKKPQINVLLYEGSPDEAKKLAADWPQFPIILCQAEDSEPPQFPEYVAHADGRKTMVLQVGHKGRYVGVVGAFKQANGGFELRYQLVPLGEVYLTPEGPAAEKGHKVLALLENYAREVKDRKLMEKVPQIPHPAQLQAQALNLSYVGSEKCSGCHAAEYTKWKDSKHSHAMEALEKYAKRPGLRNFDGECVVCHTVGFGYNTGYVNEEKTPELKHVGCEVCHGPGSGHMTAPNNAELLKLLSPWKQEKTDALPDLATMEKIAKLSPVDRGQVVLTPAQQRVINGVSRTCMKCHDGDNDPHFDLFNYWPKINHSRLGGGKVPKQ
jgi:hypothetical protein